MEFLGQDLSRFPFCKERVTVGVVAFLVVTSLVFLIYVSIHVFRARRLAAAHSLLLMDSKEALHGLAHASPP